MDPFEVPERALEAFEFATRLRVTVHDLSGDLWPFLRPDRFVHGDPLCMAVKALDGNRACGDFELKRLRRELPAQPDGRVHVCHAGFVEWVVPVFRRQRLACVFFAGLRTRGPDLRDLIHDTTPPPSRLPWRKGTVMPASVDDNEARHILESLRQTAARLRAWTAEVKKASADHTDRGPAAPLSDDLSQRRTLIRRFIHTHHGGRVRLANLARQMNLSESRAAHVVKEACGSTFVKMLNQARLRAAAGLLRHSALPVLNIARRSGFGDVSHFHRLFRKHFGRSPHQYRMKVDS